MKIVFLDAKTIGDDCDMEQFCKLGDVVVYEYSTVETMPERVKDADVLVVNKRKECIKHPCIMVFNVFLLREEGGAV